MAAVRAVVHVTPGQVVLLNTTGLSCSYHLPSLPLPSLTVSHVLRVVDHSIGLPRHLTAHSRL